MPRLLLPVLLFALLACGAAVFVVLHVGSPSPKVIVAGPPRPPWPIKTYVAMTKAFEGMDVVAEVDGALRRVA